MSKDLDWMNEPPKLEKTDFEKLFDYDVKLPTNFEISQQQKDAERPRTPDQIDFEQQDKIMVTMNWKF